MELWLLRILHYKFGTILSNSQMFELMFDQARLEVGALECSADLVGATVIIELIDVLAPY